MVTQAQLAEEIGRSVEAVSHLERGVSLPNFETLERLAEKLKVPIRELFDFEGDEKADPQRARLMATLVEIAKSLTTGDLEIAVRQISALEKRSS